MSFLLEKSKQNELAVTFLKDKQVNAAIAHCGYYSCFQKLVFVLKEHFISEYEAIQTLLAQRRKGSEHDQCIDEFIRQYAKLTDKREAHHLGNKIKDLKAFRIEADYSDMEVNDRKVEQVETNMNEFHRLVKRNFKI